MRPVLETDKFNRRGRPPMNRNIKERFVNGPDRSLFAGNTPGS